MKGNGSLSLIAYIAGQEKRDREPTPVSEAFGTCGLLLRNGKTVCCGEMEEVFSEENLRQAYEMDVYDWMRQIRQVWD